MLFAQSAGPSIISFRFSLIKQKQSLSKLLFYVRVELSSRAVASHLCRFRKQSGGLFSGKAVAGLPGQVPNVERFLPKVPVLPSSASDCSRVKQRAVSFETALSCARRVIFPGRRQPSIVTVNELNYCVRNGNRCTLITIDTHLLFFSGKEKLSKRKANSLRAAQTFLLSLLSVFFEDLYLQN